MLGTEKSSCFYRHCGQYVYWNRIGQLEKKSLVFLSISLKLQSLQLAVKLFSKNNIYHFLKLYYETLPNSFKLLD
jgi:hypothetical protein